MDSATLASLSNAFGSEWTRLLDPETQMYARDASDFISQARQKSYAEFVVEELLIVAMCFVCLAAFGRWLAKDFRGQVRLASSEQLQQAFSHTLGILCDCVVHLDADLRISAPSPKLAGLLLRSPDAPDLLGSDFGRQFASDGDRQQLVDALRLPLDANPSSMHHARLRDAMGTTFTVQVFHTEFESLDGRPQYVIGLNESGERHRDDQEEKDPSVRTSGEASAMAALAQAKTLGTGTSTGTGSAESEAGLLMPHWAPGVFARFESYTGSGSSSASSCSSSWGSDSTYGPLQVDLGAAPPHVVRSMSPVLASHLGVQQPVGSTTFIDSFDGASAAAVRELLAQQLAAAAATDGSHEAVTKDFGFVEVPALRRRFWLVVFFPVGFHSMVGQPISIRLSKSAPVDKISFPFLGGGPKQQTPELAIKDATAAEVPPRNGANGTPPLSAPFGGAGGDPHAPIPYQGKIDL